MGLETNIKMVLAAVVLSAATLGSIYGNNYRIGRHLEPQAVHCNAMDNLKYVSGINLPMLCNADVEGKGSYASVIIYEDAEGQKMFQKVIRNDEGNLIPMGTARPFK